MELTERQKYLLRACIIAERDNNYQTDTPLSLEVIEEADDPDAARDALRDELMELLKLLKTE